MNNLEKSKQIINLLTSLTSTGKIKWGYGDDATVEDDDYACVLDLQTGEKYEFSFSRHLQDNVLDNCLEIDYFPVGYSIGMDYESTVIETIEYPTLDEELKKLGDTIVSEVWGESEEFYTDIINVLTSIK